MNDRLWPILLKKSVFPDCPHTDRWKLLFWVLVLTPNWSSGRDDTAPVLFLATIAYAGFLPT